MSWDSFLRFISGKKEKEEEEQEEEETKQEKQSAVNPFWNKLFFK